MSSNKREINMMHKLVSSKLSKAVDNNLSKWDEAIAQAKRRVALLKKSIRSFEHFRKSGVPFPEPTESCKVEAAQDASAQ
jgi:anti-sigma factor RsiW